MCHKCCSLYRWKAAKDGGSAESAVAELTLKDKTGAEIEKRLPGGKVKKKAKAEVVLETTTRSKKKCVTTIQGTDIPFKPMFKSVTQEQINISNNTGSILHRGEE